MAAGLTDKQEKFISALLKGKTQREAYKSAYNVGKMNAKVIDNKARALLKQPKVKARYEKLKAELQSKDIDNAETIRRLIIEQEKAILTANLGDVYELKAVGNDLLATPRKENLKKFDMRAVQEIKYTGTGLPMLKLYDKQVAVRTLMELYGIATEEEKKEITVILNDADKYLQ